MTRTGRELLRAALARHLEGGGALVGEAMGVHGVSEGLSGPGVIRTPLSESATVGVAVGLALAGRRVVVELVDPTGVARAADVLAEVATLRARSKGAWAAPVVIRAPYAEVSVPAGLRVAVAATADDLVGMLAHALAGDEPVLLLEARAAGDDVGTGAAVPPLGTAVVRKEGSAVTVLAAGDAVAAALAAAEGTDAEVVDLRGLTPLDRATVGTRVKKTGRAVVVGVPDAATVALQEAFLHLESPLVSLPADAPPDRIAAAIVDTVHY